MYRVVKATYQDGVLKPIENLSLEEQEQVLVIVVSLSSKTPSPTPGPKRANVLKERAATWLNQQPADAVRPPARLEQAREQSLAEDFEAALAAIRARANQLPSKEIAADISQALTEIQLIPPDEQAQLEAELDAILSRAKFEEPVRPRAALFGT
jgi:predicted DNA-binding antitoxin AbrB/MazE fold protein